MTGSIAFGISAVAAYVNPVTGEVKNMGCSARGVARHWGTFVGALCFLAGALLLMPERTQDREPSRADLDSA